MAVFYTTLLYFFTLLILDRLNYLDIGRKFSEVPQYIILLFILSFSLVSLLNIIIVRDRKKYKAKIKLGYIKKHQGKMIINMGAVLYPAILFYYFYPRSAFIPFLIGLFICMSIGLTIYQGTKNIENRLPVFTSLIISIIVAMFLTPANPAFIMISVFTGVSILLVAINILLMDKKTPLFIGEKNLYHALFLVMIIALVI